jgi:hypothetical protein
MFQKRATLMTTFVRTSNPAYSKNSQEVFSFWGFRIRCLQLSYLASSIHAPPISGSWLYPAANNYGPIEIMITSLCYAVASYALLIPGSSASNILSHVSVLFPAASETVSHPRRASGNHQWMRLALSKGPNRVGFSLPSRPVIEVSSF